MKSLKNRAAFKLSPAGVISPLLLTLFLSFPAWAAETPERGLSAAFNHPGLIVGQDEGYLTLPLTIRNIGRTDDTFVVEVLEKPEGWRADIRSFSSFVHRPVCARLK